MKKMKHTMAILVTVTLVVMLATGSPVYAQQIPAGQDAGSLQRTVSEEKEQGVVTKKLRNGKQETEIEDKNVIVPDRTPEELKAAGPYVRIDKIVVEGSTVFSPKQIQKMVSPFEGKNMILEDFTRIAEMITDRYREAGFMTSYAYLPPQKVQNNTLVINVLEGIVGDVSIQPGKYFSQRLLTNYVDMKKGELFNYDALRANMDFINEHPDRTAKVVLDRGAEQGATDVNVTVDDRLPWHVTLGYNNYNSRYLYRNKFTTELKCTNFLGLDHQAAFEYQQGEAGRYYLFSGRYLIPFRNGIKWGMSYIHLEQDLGAEVKSLNIEGHGDVLSTYVSVPVIRRDDFTFSLNTGFTYKDIDNDIGGDRVSEDNIRILKLGFDADYSDPFAGRTILTQEFDWGLKDFMGGLTAEDPIASRPGAGGSFFRTSTNLARIQRLPWDMSLMYRGAMQLTPNDLVATERFNIGGVSTVRGYPVAEYSGDRGMTSTFEWYVPPYFMPKDLEIPWCHGATFFDTFRFVAFYDWGYTWNKIRLSSEDTNNSLQGVGWGLRWNVPQRFLVSLDYGYGISGKASDGTTSRIYVEVKAFF